MISRIEISFALPVELQDREMQALDAFVQRIAKRHEPLGMVHWCAECGSKPSFSQADARFLGVPVDSSAPVTGEPTFDDSILVFSTYARESYPQEEADKGWRAECKVWRRLPWYRKLFSRPPERKLVPNGD